MLEVTDICHECKHSKFILGESELEFDRSVCDYCCHGKEDLFEEKEENE
jgi:hypothetical protein